MMIVKSANTRLPQIVIYFSHQKSMLCFTLFFSVHTNTALFQSTVSLKLPIAFKLTFFANKQEENDNKQAHK